MTPLHTPRLSLIPVTPAIALAASQGVGALEEALGATIHAGWRGEYVFARARRTLLQDRPTHALIVHRPMRSVVGELRFEPVGEGAVEIGYAIVEPLRRQGLASEAAGALVLHLAGDPAVSAIVAGCDMRNVASVRTLRRIGFTLDGSSARGRAFWWRWTPDDPDPALFGDFSP